MKATFKNLFPILLPSLSLQAIEFGNLAIDSIMIGKYDPLALGGTTLASTLFYFIYVFFLGIILMTGPLVSQASGANNSMLIARTVRSGAWLSIFFIGIICAIMSFTSEFAKALNFDPKTTQYVVDYMVFKKLTAITLLIMPYRFFLTNQKVFKPIIALSLISLPINILLNWAFIYGNFGFSEMGAYGAGMASFTAYLISTILILATSTYYARQWGVSLWVRFWKMDFEIIKRIMKYGIFIGLTITIEISLFTIANIFVAGMDIYSIASFAIFFQVWNLMFGVQLGITEGANIYTAYEAGAKRFTPIIKATILTASILLCINTLISCILWLSPETLYFLYLNPTDVNAPYIIKALLSINGFLVILIFLESGVQLPIQILKSLNDTKYLPFIQATGYLIVAPSIMYISTYIYGYGLTGIVFAMFCGILTTSIAVIGRLLYTLKPENIFKYVETK